MKTRLFNLTVLFLSALAPMAAQADLPEDFTWPAAPGGSATVSTVDFDTSMELMAEFIYDNDTPFSEVDPNGEPDGVPERNGLPEPVGPPSEQNGNGILDATEFAVITEICNNINHPLHDVVHEAFKANVTQCQIDLGPVAEGLAPAMKYIMAAFVLLGDGDAQRYNYQGSDLLAESWGSWGVYAQLVFDLAPYESAWATGAPNPALYQRLTTRLSACMGDADNDAIANINEFYGQGQDRVAYVAAVLNPGVVLSASDPYRICPDDAPYRWGRNFFYNPTSQRVYYLARQTIWLAAEDMAQNFSIQGVPVPGHLATIRSSAENQWLADNVVAVAGEVCFAGGTDKDAEGVWKWIENGAQFWQGDFSGSAVGGRFENWSHPVEPNNQGDEDYLEINTAGGWNDNNYDQRRRGIIQFTNGGAGYPDTNPANGLPDWWEPYIQMASNEGEPEQDYDRDGDGMPTAWELANGFNPDDPSDAGLDADGDGLTNLQEFQHMTRPNDPDSDDDGLSDGTQENAAGTNPLNPDTDLDGLTDGAEVNIHLTDPLSGDSDNDGLPDGWEVQLGTDPLTNDVDLDPDSDGLSNVVEYQNHGNPHAEDTDGDGLFDAEELALSTKLDDADTDGDALSDYDEVWYDGNSGYDPYDPVGNPDGADTNVLNPDTDGDFLPDGAEIAALTDPLDTDTDGDLFNDRLEVYYEGESDPLDPNSPPQPKRAFSMGGIELLFADPTLNVYFPVWSSSGRQVAFIARKKVTGETDAYVTNLDTLAKRKRAKLTPLSIRITNPGELTEWRTLAWSPDGTALMYQGPQGEIVRKSASGDGVYFSSLWAPYGLDLGIHTTSLPANNRMIVSSGDNLYVYGITPSAGIESGPFLVFVPGHSEGTRFVRLNADGTKAVFNIRPGDDSTKGDIYVIDLEPILSSAVPVPHGIAAGIASGVIHAIENKPDYGQCPSFSNDGEFVLWSEDIARKFVEPVQPSNLPYTNFDVMIGSATGVGVPQQMMFPVDDGQIHTSPGGLRMSYTRNWDLYAVTLVTTQAVEGVFDVIENTVTTDAQQTVQDGSGTELDLPADVVVDFPAGADPVITMETPVTPVDDPELPPDTDAVPVVRTFGPSGTVFSQPIPVTITYTDAQIAGMAEASLKVFVYNPASGIFDIEIPETDIVTRDLDNNSITFLVDHFSTFGLAMSKDSDGDGIVDTADPDDDNDGIPDSIDPMPLDTDNDGYDNDADPDDDSDGIPDADEPGFAFDTDNDGVPNAFDFDDDGDGILDENEATLDARYDTDNDGQRNDVDLDDDGDGVPDAQEDLDHDGIWDPFTETDPLNPDTDGDGYSDRIELIMGTDPLDPLSTLSAASNTGMGVEFGVLLVLIALFAARRTSPRTKRT